MTDNVTNPKDYPFPASETIESLEKARLAEQAAYRFMHHARERISIMMETLEQLAIDLDTARSKLRTAEYSRNLWRAVAIATGVYAAVITVLAVGMTV